MPLKTAITEARLPGEGLEAFDLVEPITASNSEIEAAVKDAELPALLAALAMLSGERALIGEELKPPSPSMTARITPQGGMSSDQQTRGRALAVRTLAAYRDAGCPAAPAPSPSWLDEIVSFLIKPGSERCLDLLRHELNLHRDWGAPGWKAAEFAAANGKRVAVIGCGFAGITAAHRLKQAGVDFTVFEKNTEIGGVWWENTYPGCRLDTPNFAYSLSFAQKRDWPQQFSEQPEILKYLLDVVHRTGIRGHIRFAHEVTAMRYDVGGARWTLTFRRPDGTQHQEEYEFVITALGLLNQPSVPEIEGLASFGGDIIHSSAWNHQVELGGRRVALVGTGASAFQIGPEIAECVSRLTIFQRNPPWLLPTPNYHDDLKPGLKWLLKHVPFYGRWFRFWQVWIGVEGRLHLMEVDQDWTHPVSVSAANELLRQECLKVLEQQFADRPDLLRDAVPNYPPGAKRLLRDNGMWARMLKSPHVDLVTKDIERVSEGAIHTSAGSVHPVDVIVFATGFRAADFLHPIKVTGVGGKDLHAFWSGDCRAYKGITVPGFPNLFMTSGPNTGVVVNGSAVFFSECQVEYILRALKHMFNCGMRTIECRTGPYDEYNAYIDRGNQTKAWGVARTTSWYKNRHGRASQTWPWSLAEYWEQTSGFDSEAYTFS